MTRILVVEDDIAIVEGIADYLEAKGYELDFAYRGDHAITLVENNPYDLVLLDINLPGANGFTVCENMKQQNTLSRIPVLMMTANENLESKLSGFNAGAWDYLVKPFSLEELNVRIQVLLTLSERRMDSDFQFNDLRLNADATGLTIKGKAITLNARPLVLMKALLQSAPNTLSHQALCEKLWGPDVPDSGPLRAHIYHLRQQLKQHQSDTEIVLIKGVGYCLRAQTSNESS